MKLAQGYRWTWHFKTFFIVSSGGNFVNWSGTILAILVENHIGNIPVKFELQ